MMWYWNLNICNGRMVLGKRMRGRGKRGSLMILFWGGGFGEFMLWCFLEKEEVE